MVVALAWKIGKICTGQVILQPIPFKSDRLLGARRHDSSSIFFGQLDLSSRDKARSASSLPPVWQVGQ